MLIKSILRPVSELQPLMFIIRTDSDKYRQSDKRSKNLHRRSTVNVPVLGWTCGATVALPRALRRAHWVQVTKQLTLRLTFIVPSHGLSRYIADRLLIMTLI